MWVIAAAAVAAKPRPGQAGHPTGQLTFSYGGVPAILADAATNKPVLAVIIEPQLRDSETKRYSWPVYVTTARQRSKCPAAVLIVLCPDPSEAAKCRQLIRTGHPGFDLRPIVIDSGDPPGRNGGGPFLTLFAATMGGIDMTTERGARMVLDAIASTEVSDPDRLRMTAIILRLASDAARQTLEAIMQTSEYEKTFVERIHDQGEAEGEAKGEVKGKAEALLKLLDKRGLALSDVKRQMVKDCTEIAQLDLWFDRAITAGSSAEVFAE